MSIPPPTPCTTREKTSNGSVGDAAHIADPSVNSESVATNDLLRPKRSANQLLPICETPTAARYTVMTHSTPSIVWYSRWREGSARFTIVVSSTTMNVPTRHTPIATQRYETRPTDPSPLGTGDTCMAQAN